MSNLFPIFYLGPIEYYAEIIKHEQIILEQYEHLPKQTYRNRTEILGPNGVLKLLVPIIKTRTRLAIKDEAIADTDNWQKTHWKSLEAAYRSSPYFEFYEQDFYKLYHTPTRFLTPFNLELHEVIMRLLGVTQITKLSASYTTAEGQDYRNYFSSKKEAENQKLKDNRYIQVFSDRMQFQPNLSIVDLLFNEGPNALAYLKEIGK
ncbi:WbqC family protein [Flavobacteriales bacterium]|nr:WbqC family protein [Flavobacteriales bacterium]